MQVVLQEKLYISLSFPPPMVFRTFLHENIQTTVFVRFSLYYKLKLETHSVCAHELGTELLQRVSVIMKLVFDLGFIRRDYTLHYRLTLLDIQITSDMIPTSGFCGEHRFFRVKWSRHRYIVIMLSALSKKKNCC